ncbi:Sensor histidine kinase YpdA [compost metagenome]
MYNSYYLLYRMIKMRDYENSVLLCEHLGKFYEYITRDGEDEKMLREEVEHARVYAAIQSYRFGHRVRVEFGDLPENWAYELIPRLIIQPLLENAFHYVFEKVSPSGGNILRISFHQVDKGLIICVENSGDEDEHTIQEISNLILGGNRDGQVTALSNIHKRLQIFFGPESGLAIVKSDLGGFRVEIHIPGQRTVETE